MAFPNTIDAPDTTMQGGSFVATNDHALDHRLLGSAVVSLENKVGMGAGSAAANQLLIGQGAGTATWGSVGTALTFVNSTFNNGTLGTNLYTGGTANNQVLGTPAVTGGTANAINLGTPTLQTWNNWVQATDMGTMLGTATVPLKQGTMNVASGASSKYDIGDKVAFTQGGTQMYGYITAVPSGTTIIVCGGDDYLYGITAITLGSYSKAQTPNGFPYWFNCGTANFAGFAANPLVASTLKFAINGRLVTMQFDIQGTSSAGTFTFNGPVACNPADTYVQSVVAGDNGGIQGTPGCIGFASGGGTQINVGRLFTSFGGNSYGGFTSSGLKTAIGMFQYPC